MNPGAGAPASRLAATGRRVIRALEHRRGRARTRRPLIEPDTRLRNDTGVSRTEVLIEVKKPFWQKYAGAAGRLEITWNHPEGEREMKTFAILRRSAFPDGPDLEQAAARSTRVGDEEMSDQVRWIRSYVIEEPDGRLGTVCIYQATDPEAIREHARRAGLAADEILPVGDTVVVRDDPPAGGQAA